MSSKKMRRSTRVASVYVCVCSCLLLRTAPAPSRQVRARGRRRAAARRLTCDAVSAANSEQRRHMSQMRRRKLLSLLSSIIAVGALSSRLLGSARPGSVLAARNQCINSMHYAQLVQGPVEISRFRQCVSHLGQKLLQRRVGSFPHNAIIPCAKKRERISSIMA